MCRVKSGDALIKNQLRNFSGSPLMAMLDCVCDAILPARAATQFAQAQFHCGRPPPAALPRIRMRINSREASQSISHVRSNRARVTRALEKDRHGFQHRFNPPLFCSSHKFHWSHRSYRPYGSNYFLIKLMSPLRSTRASRTFERSSIWPLRRMSSSRS